MMHGVVNFHQLSLFSWVCEYWLVSGVTSTREKGWTRGLGERGFFCFFFSSLCAAGG